MKKFLLVSILFLGVSGFSFSSNTGKEDPLRANKKSAVNDNYLFYSPVKIETFLYNTDQFDIMAMKSASASDSVPESRTEIEYSGDMAASVNWVWENGEWQESTKTETYIRNEMTVDSTIIYMYDTVSTSYVRYSKIVTEYDGDVKTGELTYMIDSITGQMKLMMEMNYSYNSMGYLTGQETQIFVPDSNDFVPLSKEEYFVSETGVKDSSKTSYWVAELNMYQPMNKTHYFYNGDGKLDYNINFTFDFLTQTWSKVHKAAFIYNSEGYVVTENRSNWLEASQTWDLASKDSTVYEGETKPLKVINLKKSTISNEIMVYHKTYLTYDQASSAPAAEFEKNVTIYPNPASNYVTVKVNHPKNGSVQLYSFSGKLILEKQLVSQTSILPVQNLQKGNYLVKVKNDNKISSQIIVVN